MKHSFCEIVEGLIRGRTVLIAVQTREEDRAVDLFCEMCKRLGWNCLAHDGFEGFRPLAGEQTLSGARDPISALNQIERTDGKTMGVYLLKDCHESLNNPLVKRALLNATCRNARVGNPPTATGPRSRKISPHSWPPQDQRRSLRR
jgi:hypothetical protein